MNYIMMPIDFVRELLNKGNRRKAAAFMEYFYDMHNGDTNSIRFYAKSFDVSVGTVHAWIKEFNEEIDLFFTHWKLKNSGHYTSVKNQTEHQPNKLNTDKPLDLGNERKVDEHQLNKVFNINNNNNKGEISFYDSAFEDMYLRCRFSSKFTGNKEQAYIEYQKHKHIKENDMAYAYMLHANDPQTKGKTYNLTNFMKNQAYLNYLKPKIEIKKGKKLIVGYYDQSSGTVITDNNVQYTITKEKFASMVAGGEITITSSMKVA